MAKVKNVKQHIEPKKILLDGKERTIQFDMNAFAELENKFGSIENAMNVLSGGKMNDVKTVMWAGLIHDEVEEFDEDTGEPIKYSITPYQVGKMIKNPQILTEAMSVLMQAIDFGMPDPENLPEEAKKLIEEKQAQLADPDFIPGQPLGVKMAVITPTEEEAAEAKKAKNVKKA